MLRGEHLQRLWLGPGGFYQAVELPQSDQHAGLMLWGRM